jgi:flagellar motor switch protein FliN/FliY
MSEDEAIKTSDPIDEDSIVADNGAAEESGGDADWAAALEEQNDNEQTEDTVEDELSPAEFQNLTNDGVASGAKLEDVNLDVILDVPVTISMEIGRSRINIRNLLHLNQGSVVELDRLAGEPMDVLVNGTLIAHGEVVVVNDKFGIRLTDVISPAERVKRLQ